jgi:hypothetical protein
MDADDGSTVVVAVRFASRADYERLAADPAQSEWYQALLAPLLDGEPTWIDGSWLPAVEHLPARLPAQGQAPTAETAEAAEAREHA